MKSHTHTGTHTNIRASSKNQILLFLLGVIVLTFFVESYIIKDVKTIRSVMIVPLMWIPGIVAIACSYYFKNKYRDLAIVKPGNQSLIYAYAIPAFCALLTLFTLVFIDIGKFKWPATGAFKLIFIQPTLGVVMTFVLAFGEELGWRGYLHTHLMRARIPEPMIVTGLIWSMWHWPLILFGDYATSSMPWLSVALFTICMTSFSIILGWLREFSRSMVPCAVAHAVHNTWVQGIYPSFYLPGRLDPLFGGESGFVLAIIYIVIAMYLYRRHVPSSNY